MKMVRIVIIVLILLNAFDSFFVVSLAHEDILNVGYDLCNKDVTRDGEDETWYILPRLVVEEDAYGNPVYAESHLSEDIKTIKYYFESHAENDINYTWTTDIYREYIKTMSHEEAMLQAEVTAEAIKQSYADSMKRWNNVYYCDYDDDGNISYHNIINVVEGSYNDHNLSIYPIDYYKESDDSSNNITYVAATCSDGEVTMLPASYNYTEHRHYSEWKMYVNVNFFYQHGFLAGPLTENNVDYVSSTDANEYRDFIGQHELGHILGLSDVDTYCSAADGTNHHKEILMGYGSGVTEKYAKYKDIAGVSITRGFHTDQDHVWMLRTNTDGTNDVICAQCNGVRYNITISTQNNKIFYEGKSLNTYKSCIHNGGSNEKMLLVAMDATRLYYKCQYCRYIAEIDTTLVQSISSFEGHMFNDNIFAYSEKYYTINVLNTGTYNFKISFDNYSKISLYDSDLNVIKLLNEDIYSENGCDIVLSSGTYYISVTNDYLGKRHFDLSITPVTHLHEYTKWTYYSLTHHVRSCECGLQGDEIDFHVIKAGSAIGNKAYCMYCGALINTGTDIGQVGPFSITKVTLNGSYILPNGIIVLVDEDIEAYENGTLIFYDKDKLSVTQ